MSKSKPIYLEKIPKEKDYEDYLCAYLQSGGLYIEKNIIHREKKEELLELDILTTSFKEEETKNLLVEIKSGKWGFNEIFKIRGWMTYLHYDNGCFIVQKNRPSISYFKNKAKELNIELIDNSDLSKTKENLSNLFEIEPHKEDVEVIRFAYLIERKQLAVLKQRKRSSPEIKSFSELDDYFFKINSGSFYSRSPLRRIGQLFEYYLKNKNITAKICHELNGGNFEDEVTKLSQKCFKKIFYKGENSILHTSLLIEHLGRLTILKSVIEYLINQTDNEDLDTIDIEEAIDLMKLPSTIATGLKEISKEKYFYLYPIFWQFFTYVFGGFIITSMEAEEIEVLSNRTGIPKEEIPNAFDSFNKLFPRKNGWFVKIPNTSLKWHNFFPLSLSGLGANFRRFIYTEDKSFDSLYKNFPNDKTNRDLSKWNNLAYQILK